MDAWMLPPRGCCAEMVENVILLRGGSEIASPRIAFLRRRPGTEAQATTYRRKCFTSGLPRCFLWRAVSRFIAANKWHSYVGFQKIHDKCCGYHAEISGPIFHTCTWLRILPRNNQMCSGCYLRIPQPMSQICAGLRDISKIVLEMLHLRRRNFHQILWKSIIARRSPAVKRRNLACVHHGLSRRRLMRTPWWACGVQNHALQWILLIRIFRWARNYPPIGCKRNTQCKHMKNIYVPISKITTTQRSILFA